MCQVLTLDSDLSFLEEASLSVTLREALSGKNLSIRAAFDIFDADKNGSLDMVETWAALYHLGLRGISADQVVRFFDIMDEAKVGRVGFTEFHNFVEAAVQEKSHHIRLEESRPQVENLTKGVSKDKDPRGTATSEAELDQELRNLFQEEAESSSGRVSSSLSTELTSKAGHSLHLLVTLILIGTDSQGQWPRCCQ
eukprot:s3107_g1.t1